MDDRGAGALETATDMGVNLPFSVSRYVDIVRRFAENWKKRARDFPEGDPDCPVVQFLVKYRRRHIRALAAYIQSEQPYWEAYQRHSKREFYLIGADVLFL